MRVLSTYRVLKSKAFDENIDEPWIDWAIEMVEAGYESEHLYILAGERPPYNQFVMQELTTKVLLELNLDYSDKSAVIRNYAVYLINSSINRPETYFETLQTLNNIYLELDRDPDYEDFSLLCYAKEDLSLAEVQWYWHDATRENIDRIIKNKFQE